MNDKILKNQNGIAILMVTTAVALLSFILADFTFETKLNAIRIYNIQDKLQAKLNAESGLKFSLAKLKLYQEARNLIETNKQIKDLIKPSMAEEIVKQPFAYPIPTPKNLNLVQKSALKDFEKNMLIKGEIFVEMTLVNGFLNPNNLRVAPKPKSEENKENEEASQFGEPKNKKKSPQEYMELTLVKTLTKSIERKRESDEEFEAQYGNIDPELLVKELKFYVNKPENFNDSERAEIEANYLSKDIIPKHAPLTSIDELYMLEGWDDAIVNLIKDQLTVHEVSIISLNDIDEEKLRILFPDITKLQVEGFFKYRHGDKELEIKGKEFESSEDFKNLIVGKLQVVDDATYTQRVKDFENAGLRLGTAGKLFKITSKGIYGRATYTITAFIDLPIKPAPPKPKKKEKKRNPNIDPNDPNFVPEENEVNPDKDKDKKKEKPPEILLSPRIIEIRVD